jgi:hypothetical protein
MGYIRDIDVWVVVTSSQQREAEGYAAFVDDTLFSPRTNHDADRRNISNYTISK